MNRRLTTLVAAAITLAAAACGDDASDDGEAADTTAADMATTAVDTTGHDMSAPGTTALSTDATVTSTSSDEPSQATTDVDTPDTSAPQTTAAAIPTAVPGTTQAQTNDDNSGPDWVQIAQRLDDKLVEFYANPQQGLDRINEVCTPGGHCEDFFTTQLQDLVNRGEHVEGWNRFSFIGARFQSMDGDGLTDSNLVIIDFTFESSGPPYGSIVDDDGNVVEPITEGESELTDRWYLLRSGDGWRLSHWEEDV